MAQRKEMMCLYPAGFSLEGGASLGNEEEARLKNAAR